MKFSVAALLLAAATAVAAVPTTNSDVISEMMVRDSTFAASFNDILARSSVKGPLSKRSACDPNSLDACCDAQGCLSRTPCYQGCNGIQDQGGFGVLGCIAGCATACPAKKRC